MRLRKETDKESVAGSGRGKKGKGGEIFAWTDPFRMGWNMEMLTIKLYLLTNNCGTIPERPVGWIPSFNAQYTIQTGPR